MIQLPRTFFSPPYLYHDCYMPRVWLAKEASSIPFPLSPQIGLFLYNAREKRTQNKENNYYFSNGKIICPPYSKFLTLMSCTGQLELKIFIPWALVSLSFTFVSFNGWNFLVLTVHILYVTGTDNIHWKQRRNAVERLYFYSVVTFVVMKAKTSKYINNDMHRYRP